MREEEGCADATFISQRPSFAFTKQRDEPQAGKPARWVSEQTSYRTTKINDNSSSGTHAASFQCPFSVYTLGSTHSNSKSKDRRAASSARISHGYYAGDGIGSILHKFQNSLSMQEVSMEDSQNIGPAIDAKDMNDEKTGKEEQVPMRDFIFKTHRDIVATKKRVSRRSKSFPQSRNHNGNMSEQYSTPTNLFKQEDWLGKIRFWIDGQKTLRHKIRTLNRKQHYKSLGKPNKVQSPLKTRGVETEKMPVISSHHHAGNEAFRNKNYARACAHYTQAIDMLVKDFPGGKNPHLAKLHSNRAAACLALGRPLEAIEDCEKGIACDPSFVKCWIRISTCYCYKGEFRKARDLLEKAEDRFQSDDIALKEINAKFEDIASHEAKIYKILTGLGHSFKIRDGKVSLSREEVCNALQDLKAVAGFFPNAEVIYWAHAEALLRLMEFSEVQEVLSAMVKGVGATETYHALKGWLLAQTSFFEGNVNGTMLNLQALFQVLSTTSLNVEYKCMETPDLNEVRMLIGVLQNVERARMRGKQAMRTKNYGLALEAYTSALRPGLLSPILASILYCNRAASYHGLSKYILALADCFMSKALWLDNEKAYSRLATMFMELDMPDEAVKELEAGLTRSCISTARKRDFSARLLEIRSRRYSHVPKYNKLFGPELIQSADALRKHYKRLALSLHPDKFMSSCQFSCSLGGRGTCIIDQGSLIRQNLQAEASRLFSLVNHSFNVLIEKL